MASDIETFRFAIKDRYDVAKRVENLTLADRPLMAMLSKDTDFSGDGTHIPLIYSNPQGIAASGVQTAQNNATNLKGKKFILTAGDYNASVYVGDKIIKQSRNNPGAFLKNKAAEMDGLYDQMGDSLATYIYGNSGNSIGAVASASSGTGPDEGNGATDVIKLTETTQGMNFEVGMKLVASADDGSDTSHTLEAGGAFGIEGIDRSIGELYLTAGAAAVLAAGTFLFREGDFRGNTGSFIFHGLSDFIWADASPPPIYSMTRTADKIRLAGATVDSAALIGKSMEEKIRLLATQMTGVYKGKGASHGFLNPEDWDQLVTQLSAKGYRPFADSETRFGFEAISFSAGGKRIKLYADRYCPKGTCFLLRLQDWKLHSMDKLIHPIEEDGLTVLRGADNNNYEFRLVSYPSFSTCAPGWSGRVSVA